jgi:hypothetical protein
MGRQFRRQTKLKKKANYNKRVKDRVKELVKASNAAKGKPAGK